MVDIGRRKFIKTTAVTASSIALTAFCGCNSSGTSDSEDASFPGANFVVLADPHMYDTSLGTQGAAWESYLLSDRKLLAESESILDSAVRTILALDYQVDFVLVAGDLTKDGEKQSHALFQRYMTQLLDNGIKVLVVPGNHDINNPHAMAFDGDTATEVDGVTPGEFEALYTTMGFGDAIERDTGSLSYIAEPVTGLWVFCLDSCKYKDNYTNGSPETSGAFSEETLAWILENIQAAQARGKTIIGMMHHGILEHFEGQSQLTGLGDEYVVDSWETVSESLAAQGFNLMFTGHYHAQDAVKRTFDDGSYLFDVETGSLVTYPCPMRFVTIGSDHRVEITGQKIEEVDYDTGGEDFGDYARDFLETGLTVQAPYFMIQGFGLDEDTANEATPYMVRGMVAHYAGDETPSPEDLTAVQTYMASTNETVALLGGVLGALWTDLDPPDWEIAFSFDDS